MAAFFRTGDSGALLDEYERVLNDLQQCVAAMGNEDFCKVTDAQNPDPDFISAQNIVAHVVRWGYMYPTYILRHRRQDEQIAAPHFNTPVTVAGCSQALKGMFAFTEEVLQQLPPGELQRFITARDFKSPWASWCCYEQLMEHAIVHVLRHRRQIEKMKMIK